MKRKILLTAALSVLGAGVFALPVRAADPVATPATQPAADVSALIKKLGDDDFRVRQDAAEKLLAAGKSALPALKDATESTDPEIRAKAQDLMDQINRPPAPALPQPSNSANLGTNSMRVSVVNGEKTIDATGGGRTVHIEDGRDGIKMKVTGQIDGKEITQDYKAKTADELKKDSPEAYALYKQYSGNGGIGQIRFGNGVIVNGNIQLHVQGGQGGIVIQPGPGGGVIAPGLIQPLPNIKPAVDGIEQLQEKIRQQMKDAKIPDAQQEEINNMLKQLRESVQAHVPGAQAQAQDFNQLSDALRKKLSDLHLPDPGDALPPPAALRLGINVGEEATPGDGLTVLHVLPNSRGEKMGLKELDTIQKINGKEIHSTRELRKAVTEIPKGLVIEGQRDGKPLKLEEKAE